MLPQFTTHNVSTKITKTEIKNNDKQNYIKKAHLKY